MLVYSNTTHTRYDEKEAVYYKNMIQCAWMLSHPDCILLDVFESNGKLVMAFSKESHRKYIGEWAERKNEIDKKNIGSEVLLKM